MKEPPDPHAGRELVQGIENQKSGPWAEAAGGVTRPRAAHTEEHREPCERYPPTETVRAPRQDHAPDHEPSAGQDPEDASTKKARARDFGDRPAGAGGAQDGELDAQGEQLSTGHDGGPDRRQREAPGQARASGSTLRQRGSQQQEREEHAADGDRLPAQG